MANVQIITSDFLNLHISTSKQQNNAASLNEKRFAKDITIDDLKAKLELITGGNCKTMQLEVYNKDNVLVAKLNDGKALLGSFPIDDGMRLHVVDAFSLLPDAANFSGDYSSGEAVEHFKLSEEDYTKKTDTVRAFLLNNKLGQYSEEYMQKKQQQELEEEQLCEKIKVGMRCKVAVEGAPRRLGTVMYVGPVEGIPSGGKHWVGVRYDEPLGKNDGSIKGKRYFDCPPKYGGFVKPQKITTGDFPPAVDDELDLNEEI